MNISSALSDEWGWILSKPRRAGERTESHPYIEDDPPRPEDAYGISKWEAEQVLRRVAQETGLEVAILRPPLVYGHGVKGNFLRLMNIVAAGWPLPLASVRNRRSFVYLGNLVDAIAKVIDAPQAAGQTYLVSDGADVSTPELMRRIATALGVQPRLLPFPIALLRLGAAALGRAGDVTRLLGSLREHLPPGMFVIVDQFIDRTFARTKSFFGTGLVAHVSMAHPVCARLGDAIEQAAKETGIRFLRGGTYLVMEGPQFSSLAESELYRAWNCDVIGMTNMPEAKLAREAEMCYATVAMVTDYDCWHPQHDDVTVEIIVKTLLANADNARSLVKQTAPKVARLKGVCPHSCQTALEHALIAAPDARDPEMVRRLHAVAGRVLKR